MTTLWTNQMATVVTEQSKFAFNTPLALGVVIGLCVVAAAGIVVLYRRDLATRPSARSALLWVLRAGALLCLALILLEPTLISTTRYREDQSVVVLLDASSSMHLQDRLTNPDLEIETARLLGLLTPEQIEMHAKGTPAAEVLTDEQRRTIAATDRATILKHFLAARERPLFEQLRERFGLKVYRFGEKALPWKFSEDTPLREADLVLAEEIAEATNLSAALRAVEPILAKESVAGIILFTDGDWNAGADPLIEAQRIAAERVPVYTVALGNPDEVRDIEVRAPRYKKSVYLKDSVAVSVDVDASGYDGEEVTVVLRDAARALGEKRIRLRSKPREQTVRFEFTPEQTGILACVVEVAPRLDEVDTTNNRRAFEIEVVKSHRKVLLVEQYPRWEWRFLKNAIGRDPDFELTCILFNSDENPSQGEIYLDRFPTTKRELYEFDVIMFGDVSAAEFSPAQLDLLAHYVSERGAPFVFVAGERHTPYDYIGTAIESLIPVVLSNDEDALRGIVFDSSFNLELTPEGWEHPIMQLAETAEANGRVWAEMPPSYWCGTVERAKAGATVLAVHPFLSNHYGKLPLVVTHIYGNGKVLFMNIDSTWRWRYEYGDIYHYRFWGNVLRWLIATPLEGKGKYVLLSTDQERYKVNEPVEIFAQVLDHEYYPYSRGRVYVEVFNPFGGVEKVPLTLDDPKRGAFVGRYTVRSEGAYRLQSVVPELGDEGSRAILKVEVTATSLEQKSLRANTDVLRKIADITDGEFHLLTTAETIPEQIVAMSPDTEFTHQRGLWDTYYALMGFTAFMTAEWMLRKRRGFV